MRITIVAFFIFISTSLAYSQFTDMSDEELSRVLYDTAYINKLYNIVLDKNPSNRIYESKVKVASDEVYIQKWSWLNFLGVSFIYYPGFVDQVQDNSNNIDYKVGLGISLNIGSIFKVPRTISQSKERLKIEEYNLEGQKNFLKAETIRRLSSYILSIKLMKIKTQAANDAFETSYLSKIRFDKGEETLDLYNKNLSTLTNSLIEKAKGEAELVSSKATLEEFLGIKLEEVK
jgi:outer membrane protein TolC